MADTKDRKLPVQYSCYFTRSREGEQFVPEHAIAYVVSGRSMMNDGKRTKIFEEGDLYFARRNHLVKYMKQPPEGGEFRSINIYFPQEFLRNFSLEHGYRSERHVTTSAYEQLPSGGVLAKYMDSLRSYEHVLQRDSTGELMAVKQKEAILLLLDFKPEMKDILFDFSEPGKIDLEAFMQQNYHFNVDLKRFAYLTGRSLSTFKRDFETIFHLTPSRWLLQRRLEQAYFLIKEKKRAATDVYLDLGFEDLSHFSYAFKKQYGVAPSLVN